MSESKWIMKIFTDQLPLKKKKKKILDTSLARTHLTNNIDPRLYKTLLTKRPLEFQVKDQNRNNMSCVFGKSFLNRRVWSKFHELLIKLFKSQTSSPVRLHLKTVLTLPRSSSVQSISVLRVRSVFTGYFSELRYYNLGDHRINLTDGHGWKYAENRREYRYV